MAISAQELGHSGVSGAVVVEIDDLDHATVLWNHSHVEDCEISTGMKLSTTVQQQRQTRVSIVAVRLVSMAPPATIMISITSVSAM